MKNKKYKKELENFEALNLDLSPQTLQPFLKKSIRRNYLLKTCIGLLIVLIIALITVFILKLTL